MGNCINPDNEPFRKAVSSGNYVDKSGLISFANRKVDNNLRYVLVSRPHGFGKTTAANMLAAYYSQGCDSHAIFDSLEISKDSDYGKHLNGHSVVQLDMSEFCAEGKTVRDMLEEIENAVYEDLRAEYPSAELGRSSLKDMFYQISEQTKQGIVFIIDEWDCIFRAPKPYMERIQYLRYLTVLLKNKPYVSLAYMTGVLPLVFYEVEGSGPNMFHQYDMFFPYPTEKYFGFTTEEVQTLCERYGKSFEDIRRLYEGYTLDDLTMYNPSSVLSAICGTPAEDRHKETYTSLEYYVNSGIRGVKKVLRELLAGKPAFMGDCIINNFCDLLSRPDDVLVTLVHLGYLAYDRRYIRIPNKEMKDLFKSLLKPAGSRRAAKS
ncbi:MAG: AAA family ATPase [Clostridia bacterium]|nr:AAA family ATPase [Clostridia bacterium]